MTCLYLSSENTLPFEGLMEKPNFVSCKVSSQVHSSTAAVSEALLVKRREYQGYSSSNFDDFYFTHDIQAAIKHSVHLHLIRTVNQMDRVTTLLIMRNKFLDKYQ